MRTKINLLIAVTLTLLFYGCSQPQNQNVKEILQDSTKQNEIMDAICNDQQMMTNMMTHMMKNDSSMQMMMGNQNMMGHMMNGMEQDSVFSNRMCTMMMCKKGMMDSTNDTMCQKRMMMCKKGMMDATKDTMCQKGMMKGKGENQGKMHMKNQQDKGMH